MKTLNLEQMEVVLGGKVSEAQANAGCFAMGLAAGIASGCNPLVGGLAALGCFLITDY